VSRNPLAIRARPDKALAARRIPSPREIPLTIRMKATLFLPLIAGLLTVSFSHSGRAQEAQALDLFDGKSLEGWDGDPRFWKVEDGCITGQTTKEVPTEGNTFLKWTRGELDDFELTLDYKISAGGNSGVQVRSFPLGDKKWAVGGYQADFEGGDRYSGIVYGEAFRGILADRGQMTVIGADHKASVKEQFGDAGELGKVVKKENWNSMRVVFKGWTMENFINGTRTASVTDEDKEMRRRGGLLALQLHAGPPMKVQFRNIRLKRLPMGDVKKIVFIAGRPSHGPGDHEHRAGCTLLAKSLNTAAGDRFYATVYHYGWPADPTKFQNADAIVMYCDGGGGHMVNPHLAEVEAAQSRGAGVGAIHYGVEVEKGPSGNAFLKWIGGYFEAHWSVNPHWDADYKSLPQHAVASGVEPFKINDEWYYHMRFRDGMKGVTPILTALPPKETLNRPDGPHSGNPAVREAIAKGEPQHMMWVSENEGGSRGFGFTGAHFHRNWKDNNFRKVVLNAVAWIAKAEVPAGGIQTPTPSDDEMKAQLDPKGR
jgi:Domain of Unknown Function (DUF1080)/Trehalose utilisation